MIHKLFYTWAAYRTSKVVCVFPAVISSEFYRELSFPTLLDLYNLCATFIKSKHGVMHWEDHCLKKAKKKYCESVSMKMLKPWKDIWRLNLMKEDKIFIISFQTFSTKILIVINPNALKSWKTRWIPFLILELRSLTGTCWELTSEKC